jgi:ParB family chromosome partitioning protein
MTSSSTPKFSWVAIEKLHPGKHQPRIHFDEESLQELASSIAQHGILQPLVCDKNYQIIAGERRWRASIWLGLTELPCMILDVSQSEQALISLLENIQREQIEPLEEALAFKRLQDEFKWTQEHIGKMLGKSRVYITNMMRLLKLSKGVIEALQNKSLTYGHARVLVGLAEDKQVYYVDYVKTHPCSVRQLEKLVKEDKKNSTKQMSATPLYLSEYDHFARAITEQVGTQVTLDYEENGVGWLKFKFFDNDTLAGLLQKLGLSYD